MELKERYTVYLTLVSGIKIDRKTEDKIMKELETIMNKYEIFKLEATLNPFNKELYLHGK